MEAEWRIGERLIEEIERRIGERLNGLDQWYDKFDARLEEMLQAIMAIKDRSQERGGATATATMDLDSGSHESQVVQTDGSLESQKEAMEILDYPIGNLVTVSELPKIADGGFDEMTSWNGTKMIGNGIDSELYFVSSSLESKDYPKVEKSGKESDEFGSQNQRSFLQPPARENAQKVNSSFLIFLSLKKLLVQFPKPNVKMKLVAQRDDELYEGFDHRRKVFWWRGGFSIPDARGHSGIQWENESKMVELQPDQRNGEQRHGLFDGVFPLSDFASNVFGVSMGLKRSSFGGAFCCASRNRMNLFDGMDAFYLPIVVQLINILSRCGGENVPMYQPLVPNRRNKVPLHIRVPQDGIDAFTSGNNLIIQGKGVNNRMDGGYKQLRGDNLRGLCHHENAVEKPHERLLLNDHHERLLQISQELLSALYFEQLFKGLHANLVVRIDVRVTEGHLHISLVNAIEAYKMVSMKSPCSKRNSSPASIFTLLKEIGGFGHVHMGEKVVALVLTEVIMVPLAMKVKFLTSLANRVFDGGGMDGPFICVLHIGIFCYMLLHTPSAACISSQSCNDATWHRQVLRRNSQTRSTLDVHCSLRTRNFVGGVLVATNWKMHWESYEESMAVEGEPIMPVKDALAIYEKESGNSRNFLLQFGVDARAGERLYHGKVNGIEYVQSIVAFSYYRTCSQAKELTAILSVIRNLKGFSVRFPKPMVKMKLMQPTVDGLGSATYSDKITPSRLKLKMVDLIIIASTQTHDDSNNEQWLDGSFKESAENYTIDMVALAAGTLSKSLCFWTTRAWGYFSKCLGSHGQAAIVLSMFDPMKLVMDCNSKGFRKWSVVQNHYLSLEWLLIWFSKPWVKMRLERDYPGAYVLYLQGNSNVGAVDIFLRDREANLNLQLEYATAWIQNQLVAQWFVHWVHSSLAGTTWEFSEEIKLLFSRLHRGR